MKREERLDWLCRLRGHLVCLEMPAHWRTNFTHALSEEINDLQQEPCNDAISRKDTCTAIIKRLGIKDETFLLEAERTIYQQILAMPPVQPKPKTGLWEIIPKDEWDSSTAPHIKCTMCNCRPFGDVPFAFCPNCGAKMEREEKQCGK